MMSKYMDLDHIASLAKLYIDQDKREKLTCDMKQIIAFADALNVPPTNEPFCEEHTVFTSNRFREDISFTSFSREEMLSGAKTKTDAYVYVPRVVDSAE